MLFFGALIVLMTSVAMTAPHSTPPAALANWRSTVHDFGRIGQGKPVTAVFTFINKGELPLVISQAKGSCGCTGVEYPKDPVLPGQSGTIKATFNAAVTGAFNKSVTVESNAENSTQLLYVKGEVVNKSQV